MDPRADRHFRQFAAVLLILALTRGFVLGVRAPLVPSDDGRLAPVRVDPDRMLPEEWALLPGLGPELGARAHRFWHARRDLPPKERLLAVPGIGPVTLERLWPLFGSGTERGRSGH